ncbi:MAG: ABC transporter permease, partial [Oscillospiraceae bacterium]|nr:ABC transporter permease [Oscillospiraceae bacterium]
MFWRILKKDLTRKKTMNVILLLFVIICAMFTAPAVNNIFAVTNGLDGYFEKAGMADYYVISRSKSGENKAAQALEQSQYVSGFRAEQTIYAAAENMQTDSGKLMDYSNVVVLCDISDAKLNFFDPDDRIVKEVDAGKVYLSRGIADRKGVRKGDRFTVCLGDTELPLEVAGFVKDALFGSEMMGNPRFLLNSRDFQTLCADETVHSYSMGQIFYIDTADANALESELTGFSGILFSGTNKMIQTTYFMYMLVAVLILLISIGLLTVAIVVLRFTIGFTVSEEFREIGVMKAIGLRNGQIRALYLVKYLGIALIGAVIGYFAGIPFNRMLLRSVSENIVLGSSHSTLIRILCCAAVVLMILLFSWGSTRKVSRLSPIDAVRSGQTGERFRKRSLLHLGRSRLGSTGFLAANDVLSESRQYGILTVIFTICASLVMMLAVTADTLGSEGLLYLLSVSKSDAYLSDPGRAMEVMAG